MSRSSSRSKLPAGFVPVLFAGVVAAFAYALWPDEPPPQAPSAQTPPVSTPPAVQALPAAEAGIEEWVQAANHLMDQGEFAAAITGYSEVIERDPSRVEVWVDRGACRHALGDYQRAEHDFRHALSLAPDHVTATFNMGIVFYSTNRLDSARFYWSRILESAPESNEGRRVRSLLEQLEQAEG